MPSLCVGMSFFVTSYLACVEISSLLIFCTVSRILRRGLINPLQACPDWERETELLSVNSSQPSIQLVWALGALFFSRNLCFCFGCDHLKFYNKLHSSVLHSTWVFLLYTAFVRQLITTMFRSPFIRADMMIIICHFAWFWSMQSTTVLFCSINSTNVWFWHSISWDGSVKKKSTDCYYKAAPL